MSPSHQRNETHWQNFLWVRNYIKDQPRPINNVKIYGADNGRHGGDNTDAIEKMWRLIFAGGASARFHRPSSGIGLSELAKTQLRSARIFLEEFNIFKARPDTGHNLLSNREKDEAYLTRIREAHYAILFTDGGEVNLQLRGDGNSWQVKWLDISRSTWRKTGRIANKDSILLTTPADGMWVAIISNNRE